MGDRRRDDGLAESLAAWLAPTLGVTDGPASVEGLDRLSGGASRETWAFDVVAGERRWPLVLQRARRASLTGSLEGEATLLRAAAAAGVPVPGVVAATDDDSVVGGRAAVHERLPGEAVARKVLRDDTLAEGRRALVAQVAAACAAIHRIDVGAAPHLRFDEPVAQLRALHAMVGHARPVFDVAMVWLDAHRPTPCEPVVVHGDLRLGNLLVDVDGLVAVLDWELAHLGDPAEDLAWACVKAWRYGASSPALGVGSVDELLEAYAAAGGSPPDRNRFWWWLVLGTLRWGVICELQAAQHLSGATRSVELATIGRRVVETEHDLVDLLGFLATSAAIPTVPEPAPPAPDGGPAKPPHPAPSLLGLVDAVRGFLADDVMGGDEVGSRERFHARVATNALSMVVRELQVGDAQRAAHAERLAGLGVADDRELIAALADGRLGVADPRLAAHLAISTLDALVVANPAYLVTPPADPWASPDVTG